MQVYVNVGLEKPISFARSSGKMYLVMYHVLRLLAKGPVDGMTAAVLLALLEVDPEDSLGVWQQQHRVYAALRRMNQTRLIYDRNGWPSKERTPRLVEQKGGITDKGKIWTITKAGRLALEDLERQSFDEEAV